MYYIPQAAEQKYKQGSLGLEQHVDFESNEIKLDIPMEGTKLKEGWKITPLAVPVVSSSLHMLLTHLYSYYNCLIQSFLLT